MTLLSETTRPIRPSRLTAARALPALPKAPVMGWRSLWPVAGYKLPSVGDLPHAAYTTSGRAALLASLRQLDLPVNSTVLVPTYHCPTMVAPVLQAGLKPNFFPIGPDGLPLLDAIDAGLAATARVMFVAHYFGVPKSLYAVREWCNARGITLVEDCAHSYFGSAGDRPVGCWGDYATASLSKFFPVSEGGLLASAYHTLVPLGLRRAGLRAEIKGGMDVIEFAHHHGHLTGLATVAAPLFWLKNGRISSPAIRPHLRQQLSDDASRVSTMLAGCDMARSEVSASGAAVALHKLLPTGHIVQRRRQNFANLLAGLEGNPGTRLLAPVLPDTAAPYVCPLWIDDAARADAIYAAMRVERLPVFRWDQIWPGTPADSQDCGPRWSRHVLQMLCHQNLRDSDITHVIRTIARILQAS